MLQNNSFRHLFWSSVDNFLQQILNFVVGIILARILVPEDFGLIGIATFFITVTNVLVEGGFGAALGAAYAAGIAVVLEQHLSIKRTLHKPIIALSSL